MFVFVPLIVLMLRNSTTRTIAYFLLWQILFVRLCCRAMQGRWLDMSLYTEGAAFIEINKMLIECDVDE